MLTPEQEAAERVHHSTALAEKLIEIRRQRDRSKWGEDFVTSCRVAGLTEGGWVY